MTSFRTLGAFVLAVAWLFAGAVAAEDEQKIPVKVLVTHVSNEGSGIDRDPWARDLQVDLQKHQMPFDTVKVIHKRRVMMALDEVYPVALPNGRKASIRPISQRENSVLMAVDVEGSVKVDARVRRQTPFIIRAGKHDGGNLLLSLELDN